MQTTYIANTIIAFSISGLIYLICLWLFRFWAPLPAIISWSAVLYLGIGLGIGAIYGMVLLFPFILVFGAFGGYFLGASSRSNSPYKYIFSFIAMYPIQILLLVAGMMNPFIPKEGNYGFFYFIFLFFAFNLFSLGLWSLDGKNRFLSKNSNLNS